MEFGRTAAKGLALTFAALALVPACKSRKQAEVVPIIPKFEVNRNRAPLGSVVEATYTWQVEPGAPKIPADHKVFAHYLDSHNVVLFTDDHVPVPPVTSWEPGKNYSYTRTVFIPVYPYVGEVSVVMGLYPVTGRGERIALKGEDIGLRAYKVASMEFLPQTENIFLVYKDGWHNPESSPQNPSLERTWTKKDALVSFKNPKKDIVIYLEADTNRKAFDAPPVLTVAVGGKTGLIIPIEDSEIFLKKIRVKAADLGNDEWVDLRLSMNQSFVPKAKAVNTTDDRELGVMVYHLYVGEAEKLGQLKDVVDAGPVTLGPVTAAVTPATPAAKPGPAGKIANPAGPATVPTKGASPAAKPQTPTAK